MTFLDQIVVVDRYTHIVNYVVPFSLWVVFEINVFVVTVDIVVVVISGIVADKTYFLSIIFSLKFYRKQPFNNITKPYLETNKTVNF